MNKTRVALIGYGHLGKWHAEKVEKTGMARLIAIVESFPANQAAARDKFPGVKIVASLSEVISEIDAAFIVTPTAFHAKFVRELVAAQKHIFCEKPLCATKEESQILEKELQGYPLVFQTGHSERFHQIWSMLEQKGLEKYLKAPFHVTFKRMGAFKGRATDVDVVSDLMIHDLDLLHFIFKVEPQKISSFGAKIRTDKWDYVNTTITLSQGSCANIIASRNHTGEERDVFIVSKAGTLHINLMTNEYTVAPAGEALITKESYPKGDHLFLEHQAFYRSIQHQTPSVVPWEEGLKICRWIDQVHDSLQS